MHRRDHRNRRALDRTAQLAQRRRSLRTVEVANFDTRRKGLATRRDHDCARLRRSERLPKCRTKRRHDGLRKRIRRRMIDRKHRDTLGALHGDRPSHLVTLPW